MSLKSVMWTPKTSLPNYSFKSHFITYNYFTLDINRIILFQVSILNAEFFCLYYLLVCVFFFGWLIYSKTVYCLVAKSGIQWITGSGFLPSSNVVRCKRVHIDFYGFRNVCCRSERVYSILCFLEEKQILQFQLWM